MKKKIICGFAIASFIAFLPASASAWDLQSLLKQAGETLSDKNTITNVIEGVFSTSNIEVKDLAGTWSVTGSAVSAQTEDAFGKATAVAGAAVLEGKLDPYYKKYGLTGSVFTINADGTFTMKLKKLNISGTIEKDTDGNFLFHFNTFGVTSLGTVQTYVTKSLNSMSLMFDSTRLMAIINGIASASKIQMAQTASSLLQSYDNIYVGFKLAPYTGK